MEEEWATLFRDAESKRKQSLGLECVRGDISSSGNGEWRKDQNGVSRDQEMHEQEQDQMAT